MPLNTSIGHRIVPALLVNDVKETLGFYGKLGFRLTGCHPSASDPTWAEVQRDEVVFQFHVDPPRGTSPKPVFSGTFYLFPDSVADLAEELSGRVEFAWGPEEMHYGMHEFGIRDPNGYYLAFTEPI